MVGDVCTAREGAVPLPLPVAAALADSSKHRATSSAIAPTRKPHTLALLAPPPNPCSTADAEPSCPAFILRRALGPVPSSSSEGALSVRDEDRRNAPSTCARLRRWLGVGEGVGVGVLVAVRVGAASALRVGVGLHTNVVLGEALRVAAAVPVALPSVPAVVTEADGMGGAVGAAVGDASLGEALSVAPAEALGAALPLREGVALGVGVAGAVDRALSEGPEDPEEETLGEGEVLGERLPEAVLQGLAEKEALPEAARLALALPLALPAREASADALAAAVREALAQGEVEKVPASGSGGEGVPCALAEAVEDCEGGAGDGVGVVLAPETLALCAGEAVGCSVGAPLPVCVALPAVAV